MQKDIAYETDIVIEIPLGMCIDREIIEPYGYDLFYGDENIEAQWKKLEELRETGGVIIVQPSCNAQFASC